MLRRNRLRDTDRLETSSEPGFTYSSLPIFPKLTSEAIRDILRTGKITNSPNSASMSKMTSRNTPAFSPFSVARALAVSLTAARVCGPEAAGGKTIAQLVQNGTTRAQVVPGLSSESWYLGWHSRCLVGLPNGNHGRTGL